MVRRPIVSTFASTDGLSIASSKHYVGAVESFGKWLVRDLRSSDNPLFHLAKLNAKVDVRHERRASTIGELGRLFDATECSTRTIGRMGGSTRAMFYRLAAMTGLRANELASLTPASFDLTSDVSTVTIEAGYSKRCRKDVLPLHSDLVPRLDQWLTKRDRSSDDQPVVLKWNRAADAKPERLFPGKRFKKAAQMLRADLEAAEIAYETDDGCADVHSLRHTFISNLANGGVHPKLAQQLARHSTITLTMDRYSHVGFLDRNAALESLPVTAPECQTMRATGKTDECAVGCNTPAEIDHSEPFPVLQRRSDTRQTSTTKSLVSRGKTRLFKSSM